MGATAEFSARAGRDNSSSYDGDDDLQDVGRRLGETKRWPTGVRFQPTDEELVLFYLKRKICRQRIRPTMVGEVDVYKCEPWELPEKSLLKKGDKQWFFFSPRDRKYPNGSRSNRATKHGYWKATGKDRGISHLSKSAGNKKTLVYYRGRAPKGARTDWVMHEYTLDENFLVSFNNVQDSYALYKLFMKSGLGPKVGEQYGAPFREEEWEDAAMDQSFMEQNDEEGLSAAVLTSNSIPVTFSEEVGDTFPVSDLEALLIQLSQEPEIFPEDPDISSYTYDDVSKLQVDLEPGIGSHIINPINFDVDDSVLGSDTLGEKRSIDTRFQNMPSISTHSQPNGIPNMISEHPIVAGDDEFLEIKDLNDPMTAYNLDNITDRNLNLRFDTNEFHDSYDHFDADMFLREAMGMPIDPNVHLDSYSVEDPQNHGLHISNQLWADDETYTLTTLSNTNEVASIPPAAGFSNARNSPTTSDTDVVEQISHAESPSQTWFNSAMLDFLDSIPTSPALASETVISRALVRVSSFRTATMARQQRGGVISGGRRNNDRGYLFLSLLVGIGAVFWVLTIGAALKIVKGLWDRFISS